MASRIQGITVEIGGDTTKLSKALESVNKSIKGTQSGLKDVNKLLKLDPSNTELVVQKQKMLKDAIEATKEKLATLKTAAQQANEQLANGEITQQQYDALQREIVETEQNLRSLQDQAATTNATLAKIGRERNSFQQPFEHIVLHDKLCRNMLLCRFVLDKGFQLHRIFCNHSKTSMYRSTLGFTRSWSAYCISL